MHCNCSRYHVRYANLNTFLELPTLAVALFIPKILIVLKVCLIPQLRFRYGEETVTFSRAFAHAGEQADCHDRVPLFVCDWFMIRYNARLHHLLQKSCYDIGTYTFQTSAMILICCGVFVAIDTSSANLHSIGTNGLFSKRERTAAAVTSASTHGAVYGDGIYVGNNPHTFSRYGDTCVVCIVIRGHEVCRSVAIT